MRALRQIGRFFAWIIGFIGDVLDEVIDDVLD